MKRLLLRGALTALLVAAGLLFHSQTAAAVASGCGQKVKGGEVSDLCVVMVINLTGTLPGGNITVTGTRQHSIGTDDTITLVNQASSTQPGICADKYEWTCNSKFTSANQYTSFYGVFGTVIDGGSNGCTDATQATNYKYNISVKANGITVGSGTANLCNYSLGGGSKAAKISSTTIGVVSSSSSTGGVKGEAKYFNTITNKGGDCTAESFVEIWGGPKNIAQNKATQVRVGAGGLYTTNLTTLAAGGGYSVALTCYDATSQSGASRNTYTDTQTGITIPKGGFVTVNFSRTGAANQGGGGQVPGGAGSAQDSTPSCENTGFALAWIMCRLIDGTADAVNGLYVGLIQPMLRVPSLSTSGSGRDVEAAVHLKAAWTSFRAIADVLLVVALIVIVFGESIGGGMIDAYTAKKVLPRLLIAAILVNLSYYLMQAALDITNVIGGAIAELITKPFGLKQANGTFVFDLSGQGNGVSTFLTTAGGGAAAIGALYLNAGTIGSGASVGTTLTMALYSVLLPLLVVILAIVVTLAIWRALIFATVLLAPLAFAAYVLPNTEQYFKRWWKLTQETLLVYPIIAVMFGLSQVVAQLNLWANTGGVAGALSFIVSLIILIIPLAAIPFAFKLAGGLLGRVHELAHTGFERGRGLINGNEKDPFSRRNVATQKFADERLQSRERAYDALNSRGAIGRFAARRLGGPNLKAEVSAKNARLMKQAQDQNNTGDDTELRALSVDRRMLDANYRAANGIEGTDYRTKDGKMQFRTLGGAWVGEGDVTSAYARWGNDTSTMQWSLEHEMDKAATQDEHDYLKNNFGRLAGNDGSWGSQMSEGQRAGLWKGAAFSKQNVDRQWKHYNVDKNTGSLKMGASEALSLFREIDEKQGNYAMMQQNADTWTTMSGAMEEARRVVDTASSSPEDRAKAEEILKRGARIAFSTQSSSMASTPIPGADGDVSAPTAFTTPSPGGGGRAVGAGAAGRVQEEMIRFVNASAQHAGIYQEPGRGAVYKDPSTGSEFRPAGAPRGSLDQRESDRTAPGSPDGTETGGSGPRSVT